eukprot:scaffold647196_cov19-Prasinocladus_malaysianus.AAC.1
MARDWILAGFGPSRQGILVLVRVWDTNWGPVFVRYLGLPYQLMKSTVPVLFTLIVPVLFTHTTACGTAMSSKMRRTSTEL